jgi:hypothetical protein
LKSFGTFKVVKLDEASETPDSAMLTLLTQMDRKINRLSNEIPRRSIGARRKEEDREDKEEDREDIVFSAKLIRDMAEFIRACLQLGDSQINY